LWSSPRARTTHSYTNTLSLTPHTYSHTHTHTLSHTNSHTNSHTQELQELRTMVTALMDSLEALVNKELHDKLPP